MNDTKFSVAIFPFLKTSKPVTIGRYYFRCTTDLEGLSDDKAAAVTQIASMLYLRDDVRITHAAYAIAEPLDSLRPGPTAERLEKVRGVIGYIYSAPHPTSGDVFLPFESATLAVLEPAKVSLYLIRPDHQAVTTDEVSSLGADKHGRLQGYEGVLNLTQPLWLAAGSRLYGPKPNMVLDFSQDFAVQFPTIAMSERPDFRLLMNLVDKPASPFNERIFTALNWYNGANMGNTDLNKSLLALAVAFETLLQLPAGEKTDRLVDAISLLLGRTDRLADWAIQFYAARSQVVHEGRVKDWRFYTQRTRKKEDLPHSAGSVMNYGRQIFQLCMATILTGASLAEAVGLKERFIANSERYAAIAATASAFGQDHIEQLAAIHPLVIELSTYRYIPSAGLTIDLVLAAVRATVNALLKTKLELVNVVKPSLEAFAAAPRKDVFKSLKALSDLSDAFEKTKAALHEHPMETVALLASIAWQDLFMTYFDMLEQRQRATSSDMKEP